MIKTTIGGAVERAHPVVVCTVLSLVKQTHSSVGHFCDVTCCQKGVCIWLLYIHTGESKESSVVIATISFCSKAFEFPGWPPSALIILSGTAIV